MNFKQRSALLSFTLLFTTPILTGFGPSRPVPLPAAELRSGFGTAPRADVFHLWFGPQSSSTPLNVWLGTDSDNIATAGVQLWDGGPVAREVYTTRDLSAPPANGRTDLTAIGFQGDRVFVALRGGHGSRPTPSGSWIESSSSSAHSDWQVEFATSSGWNFLIRGFQNLASGEIMAWGTSDAGAACAGNGLLGWTAVRDVAGHWTQTALPTTYCNEIPLGALASSEGRGVRLVTQAGVVEGEAGSVEWSRSVQWKLGVALQGKTQGDSAILLFGDGSLRQWHPGTDGLQLIANAPIGARLPEAGQARWSEARSGWDSLGAGSAVWLTAAYHQRAHCHPPVIIIPMPGPVGNPCQDLISEVRSWNGREWQVVASAYGNSMTGVYLADNGQLYVPSNGEVKTLSLAR